MGSPAAVDSTVTFNGEEEQPLLMLAKPWKAPQMTTQQTLQLQVKPVTGPPRYLSIQLQDGDGDPLADLHYLLNLEGENGAVQQRVDGVTDSKGVIEQMVGPEISNGTLVYWLEKDNPDSIVVKAVDIGVLSKSMDSTMLSKRLTNLAYLNTADDDPGLVFHNEAMTRFKSRHGLIPQADEEQVRQKLMLG
jgi:hypothetical protein